MEINVRFDNLKELSRFVKDLAPLIGQPSSEIAEKVTKAINKKTAPAEPAEPAEPAKPAKPAEPAEPAAPAKPAEPAAPAKPAHTAAELREILFNLNHEANPDGQPMTINKAKEVINALGYASFKDVPEEKYDELYTAVDKAMKELDHAG